jgi:predicted esterase
MTFPISTSRVSVTRTARFATTGADLPHAVHLWVVLHGYGQLASEFIAPFAEAAPPGVRIVAPEGLSRFYLELPRPDGGHLTRTGATWLTRDDRDDDLRDALGMLHTVVQRELTAIRQARGAAPMLHLLGFSQGVAMSMRYAVDRLARDAAAVPLATQVLWAGGLAHDVSDDALYEAWQQTALHVVVGARDRFASDTFRESVRSRLAGIGHPVTTHAFEGGHRIDTPLLRALLRTPPGLDG